MFITTWILLVLLTNMTREVIITNKKGESFLIRLLTYISHAQSQT